MHTTKDRHIRTIIRPARFLTASLISLIYAGGAAHAANSPTPRIPGYTAAQQKIHSHEVLDSVSRFLTATGQAKFAAADGGSTGTPRQERKSTADPASLRLQDPAPLYEITPAFLTSKDKPTRQTALRLSYLVSQASTGDGQNAAVLLTPGSRDASWELASIRDGDAEVRLAARATDGSQVFSEPQIHAWYRLTQDDHVLPLNPEAVTSLGRAQAVSLTDYQKLVQGRYANKTPGTAYDSKGLAGGFNATAPTDAAAEDTNDAKASPPGLSGNRTAMLGATAAVVLAVAGGAPLLLRRRAPTKTV
ncbi:hypothetical protein OV450_8392 [Actinobacteria bacterium OV450]|nr:hypothetical protein OV450_8392 [Actinobacteria bacterium OV450]